MELVAAIVEFLSVQRPLLDKATSDLGYYAYPPYQWAQSGTVDIAGAQWTYTKVGDTGYRFENRERVVLEIPEILERTVDSIVVGSFTQYLATKGVSELVLERETARVDNDDELSGLLEMLVETGLLSHPASGEYRRDKHVDLSAAVEVALEMGHVHFEVALDRYVVEGVFLELLWGPRQTWPRTEQRTITPLEAANLVIAHLHSRLIANVTPARFGWEAVGAPLQRELTKVLPCCGT